MTLIYFVLILGLVIFIHEFGHFIMAKKHGVYCYEFSLGMGPKIYSFRRKNDETEYCLRLFPIGGFVQMAGEEVEDDKDVPKNKKMQAKTVWQRLSIVVAGVFNNFLLGLVLLFLMALFYGSSELKPIIKESSYNAKIVKIEKGDVIKKINNKKVKTLDDVLLEFQMIEKGSNVDLVLEKNGTSRKVTVVPTKDDDGNLVYGLTFSTDVHKGFVPSVKYAFVKFASIYRNMFKVIGSLFTGRLGINSLSGPVGIYNVIGEQSKMGFQNVIYLTAYISINVGFVNLIPFPAFDGGRALFLIIEKIRKKPIDQKVENTIHTIGFALLMLLIVVITINDIIRLF